MLYTPEITSLRESGMEAMNAPIIYVYTPTFSIKTFVNFVLWIQKTSAKSFNFVKRTDSFLVG